MDNTSLPPLDRAIVDAHNFADGLAAGAFWKILIERHTLVDSTLRNAAAALSLPIALDATAAELEKEFDAFYNDAFQRLSDLPESEYERIWAQA